MTLAALIGLASILLAFRIFGPSDLDLKDQPKTVSYTLDIVENGRWVWPHDMMGNPATKPPFYNWIGAGAVYLTGMSNEFVLKMPTLLAVAGIFTVMYLSFKSFIPQTSVKTQQTISFLSMLLFISNVSVYVLSYVARPDMMLTCWLFTGWSCVTILIDNNSRIQKSNKALKALLWISFSAALLTKGPPAVLLPLYIILVGIYQRRFKEILQQCGFAVGILLGLLPVVLWFISALQVESEYIFGSLAISEIERISSDLSWFDRLRDLYKMPFYFFVRFMPWSPFLIYFYFRFKDEAKETPWIGQAFIWVIMIIVFFSFPTFKRDDYLLPAFPVAAMLTGYFISQIQQKWFRRFVLAAAYAVILFLGFNDIYTKEQLKSRHGDHVKHFASVVRNHISDVKKLVFYDTGYHPLQSYLGRNQAAIKPDPTVFDRADWLVAPIDELFRPETSLYHYARLEKTAESDLILKVAGQHEGRLALFKIIR
ncbi:MAG: ArnT family glycosyltransferase [Gammaproteobacteria bacterium]